MGGKKGVPSAKEKEAVKAKERASQAAASQEESEWTDAGTVHVDSSVYQIDGVMNPGPSRHLSSGASAGTPKLRECARLV